MNEDDAKDAAWDKLMSNEIGVWLENLYDGDAEIVRGVFDISWSESRLHKNATDTARPRSLNKTPDPECEDCHEVKPDVIERKCPYAAEIHNKVEMVTICDRCSHNRCMDI